PLKGITEQEKKVLNRPVSELPQTGGESPAVSSALGGQPPQRPAGLSPVQQLSRTIQHFMQDAPPCDVCGAITVRNGTCYKCLNCGASMGCS
ncbi:MAG: hypothetical protein N3B01_08555, partial [Verrucomicrobiae bacterium]|nr:hypothetical protein [Verrucomicrobiae bacterium]